MRHVCAALFAFYIWQQMLLTSNDKTTVRQTYTPTDRLTSTLKFYCSNKFLRAPSTLFIHFTSQPFQSLNALLWMQAAATTVTSRNETHITTWSERDQTYIMTQLKLILLGTWCLSQEKTPALVRHVVCVIKLLRPNLRIGSAKLQ